MVKSFVQGLQLTCEPANDSGHSKALSLMAPPGIECLVIYTKTCGRVLASGYSHNNVCHILS